MPGRYDDDDGPAAGGERLGGRIFEGGYFTSRYEFNMGPEAHTKRSMEAQAINSEVEAKAFS